MTFKYKHEHSDGWNEYGGDHNNLEEIAVEVGSDYFLDNEEAADADSFVLEVEVQKDNDKPIKYRITAEVSVGFDADEIG